MTRKELIEVMARAIDRLEYLALARAENATDRNDAKAASAAARAALSALEDDCADFYALCEIKVDIQYIGN